MSSTLVHPDIGVVPFEDVTSVMKVAKNEYLADIRHRVRQAKKNSVAAMFTSPDSIDVARDWRDITDVKDDSGTYSDVTVKIVHRVVVVHNESAVGKVTWESGDLFSNISDFVTDKTKIPDSGNSTVQSKMMWEQYVQKTADKTKQCVMRCYKLGLGSAHSNTGSSTYNEFWVNALKVFDTVVFLKMSGVMGSRWLVWLYDSARYDDGDGYYAMVSNDLQFAGFGALYDRTAMRAVDSVPLLTVNSENHLTANIANKTDWYKVTVARGDNIGATKTVNVDWEIKPKTPGGVRLFFCAGGIFQLDAWKGIRDLDPAGVGSGVPDGRSKNSTTHLEEVLCRTAPDWFFQTLLCDLSDEIELSKRTMKVDTDRTAKKNSELMRNFEGQIEASDCGVACVVQRLRGNTIPYAFVNTRVPMACFMHNAGSSAGSLISKLSLSHQCVMTQMSVTQQQSNNYVDSVLRLNPLVDAGTCPRGTVGPVDNREFMCKLSVQYITFDAKLKPSEKDNTRRVISNIVNIKRRQFHEKIAFGDFLGTQGDLLLLLSSNAQGVKDWFMSTDNDKKLDAFTGMKKLLMGSGKRDKSDTKQSNVYEFFHRIFFDENRAIEEMWSTSDQGASVRVLSQSRDFINKRVLKNDASLLRRCKALQNLRVIKDANDKLPKGKCVLVVDAENKRCLKIDIKVVLSPAFLDEKTVCVTSSSIAPVQHGGDKGIATGVKAYQSNIKIYSRSEVLLDDLIAVYKKAKRVWNSANTVESISWNGGRCFYISEQSDAQCALDESVVPTYFMLLAPQVDSHDRPAKAGHAAAKEGSDSEQLKLLGMKQVADGGIHKCNHQATYMLSLVLDFLGFIERDQQLRNHDDLQTFRRAFMRSYTVYQTEWANAIHNQALYKNEMEKYCKRHGVNYFSPMQPDPDA